MKIYLDEFNRCHAEPKEGFTEAENAFFDSVPFAAVECYKYYPETGFIQCVDSKVDAGIARQHLIDDTAIKDLVTFLPDEAAVERTVLFPVWTPWADYAVDFRVQHEGTLYKCVQAHTSQDGWTPDVTPALWTRVSIDEWPDWVQPTGAQDAYNAGDKVTHKETRWISDVDSNVWEPGIYGWTEAE